MIVVNNTDDELVGVTGMPVCFMSPNLTNPMTWENNLILAWSTNYVYLNDGVGIFNSSKWMRFSFNQQFPGSSFFFEELPAISRIIALVHYIYYVYKFLISNL